MGGGARKRRNLSAVKTGNSRRTKKTEIHFLSICIYARRLIEYMIPYNNDCY